MAEYEYCVTEAEWGMSLPEPDGTRNGLLALVFKPPMRAVDKRINNGICIDHERVKSVDVGWEYVRHDCVGGPDGLIVAVTWRREVSNG